MNFRPINGGPINSVISTGPRGLTTYFTDTLFMCPPITTFIAPESRLITIAEEDTTIIIKESNETASI